MQHAATAHVDELIRAASGPASGRDAVIERSWRRCLEEYRLDPGAPRRAFIHTQARLREHRDALDDLIRVARSGTEALYRQVSGLGYVLILADAEGVAVDFIGNAAQDEALRRAGLYRGSDWNERLAGTCAVGTCIAAGEALTVHLDDHFAGDHIALTCTAAPIFASDGSLAAVLDISALRSPVPKSSQHLALQLVRSVAHRIETASLHNRFRRDWVLHLSRSREFTDIEPELAIAVDAEGRLVGFNSEARRSIERALGSGAAPRGLLGRRFEALFEASIDDLPHLTRSTPFERRTLRLRGGETFFARALRPVEPPRPRSRSVAAPTAAPVPAVPDDPARATALRRAARLFEAGLPLLLRGETGTGKEHLARALHAGSARAAGPFVPVNCAALPEALIEAELFGHEPGAFTGAAPRGRPGLVRQAEGGTLFLDEIGDMPLPAQIRLLRVLAEREVAAVGGARPRRVDFRVIAATHRDLSALVREGRFREDLLFRLNGAELVLPPLRERRDLDALCDRLLRERHPAAPPLSAAARALLHRHRWPGNVRELQHALDHACALADGAELEPGDLPPALAAIGPPDGRASGDAIANGDAVGLAERLRRRDWNISAVARDLGIDRTTLHRRMRRLGLRPPNKAG